MAAAISGPKILAKPLGSPRFRNVLTSALDIDNHGRIAGQYLDASGMFHSFLRDARGGFTAIDVPGATGTGVFALNDRGQTWASTAMPTEHFRASFGQ
jgi:hypothetical protein